MPIYEGIGLISEKQPVVVEIGAAYTKIGFCGENCPKTILRTDKIIPIQRSAEKASGSDRPNRISTYLVRCSVEQENELYGLLVQFFHNIYFRHLLATPKDRRIVIVESLLTNSTWRRMVAKVLFLHFEVLHILYMPSPLSAVAALGNHTALVVDVGHNEAVVVPVIAGVTLLSYIHCHELGAKQYDCRLHDLLLENCLNPKVTKEELKHILENPDLIEDVRVRACFVIGHNKKEQIDQLKMKPLQYATNYGYSLQFSGIVRGKAAEMWFDNTDLDGISLPLMILDTLAKCPIDTRKFLSRSILLTGGTTLLSGFKSRLLRELKHLSTTLTSRYGKKFNDDYEFRIFNTSTVENCLNWLGGSLYGTNEIIALRGVSKEYFLKYGIVPDWSDWIKTRALPPVAVPQLILP